MIEIKIPFKTPTINHLYGQRRSGVRFIKQEAVDLKKVIQLIIMNLKIIHPNLSGKKLSVTTEIHEDWFCKNGSVKRKDISNREKFLIDSVFEALGLEDKFIFEHTMRKIQSDKEFAVIQIKEIYVGMKCFWCEKIFQNAPALISHTKEEHPKLSPRSYDAIIK